MVEFKGVAIGCHVDGWKGKDGIEVKSFHGGFIVIEHRKEKESGKVATEEHEVDRGSVNILWSIIVPFRASEKYGYRYIVKALVEKYRLHENEGLTVQQMVEAFNGGKYRSSYYFPLYYYPMKVLESYGYIHFWGRGGATRLKEGEFND